MSSVDAPAAEAYPMLASVKSGVAAIARSRIRRLVRAVIYAWSHGYVALRTCAFAGSQGSRNRVSPEAPSRALPNASGSYRY